MKTRQILFFNFFFLILVTTVRATDNKINKINKEVLSIFENDFVYRIGDVTDYVTRNLADFNDKRLGNSEWGRILGYEDLKPKLLEDNMRSKWKICGLRNIY